MWGKSLNDPINPDQGLRIWAEVDKAKINDTSDNKSKNVQIELHKNTLQLEAFRRGDSRVMEAIYRQFSPALLRFLQAGFSSTSQGRSFRVSVSDPLERHDLLQETFARAFTPKARESYNGQQPYGPFLLRICRNLAVDKARSTQRWGKLVVADAPSKDPERPGRIEMAPSKKKSPEETAQQNQLAEVLQGLISSLPEEERALLKLFYEDEASQRDAAQSMGLTRNQIRTLVTRIRKKVLEHMRGAGFIQQSDPRELLSLVSLVFVLTLALLPPGGIL